MVLSEISVNTLGLYFHFYFREHTNCGKYRNLIVVFVGGFFFAFDLKNIFCERSVYKFEKKILELLKCIVK